MLEIKTSSKPFLSIIVPCLDCEKSLGHLFDNLRELKNASCEVIFVDNGSTDGTSTLLKKFSSGPKRKMFDTFILTNKAGLEQRGNMELKRLSGNTFFL